MLAYKVVFHDVDGEPIAESDMEYSGDDAARRHADAHSHPYEKQVWQGDRLICRIPPRDRD